MDSIPSEASVGQLLATYRSVLNELKRRGVLRTDNAPAGDYAEYLVAAHLEGELAPNSEKSWDVRTSDGHRIQVKARVVTDGEDRGHRQLPVIPTWDFDLLAVVLFDDNYRVGRAALVPIAAAEEASRFVRHINGYRLYATDQFLGRPAVEDITESLRNTASRI